MLKLLKMATGMRALLDTVVQALPQVNTRASFTHSGESVFFCLFFFLSRCRHFLQVGESSAPQRVSLARAHAGSCLVFSLGTAQSSQTPAASAACWKERGLLKTAHSSSDGEIHVCLDFLSCQKWTPQVNSGLCPNGEKKLG